MGIFGSTKKKKSNSIKLNKNMSEKQIDSAIAKIEQKGRKIQKIAKAKKMLDAVNNIKV